MAEPAPAAIAPVPAPERTRDADPYWVFLTRFSGESERAMRGCLDRIAAMILAVPDAPGPGAAFAWETLRYPQVLSLRGQLAGRQPPLSLSHIWKHQSALRGVLREAWQLGLMTAEDYQRAREVPNIKGRRQGAGRSLHQDELAAMLAACQADDRPLHAARDAALIAVLHSTGMRRAEAAAALAEQYDHAERALRVIGKGNKQRTVFIFPGAVPYLDRWLVAVGERRGPMFRRINRWGHIGGAMTGSAIGAIVAKRRDQAGLPPLSTHDFRHTNIGDLLDAGADLAEVQKLAGHASATTTASYDRRPGRALRTAVDRLHLPPPDELTGA